MGDFIILNADDSIMLSNPQNTQTYNVSVATIRAFASSNNSFIVGRNTDGIGYWVRYFNINADLTDVYLADYTYMSNNRSGFNLGTVSITENAQGMYGYNGSSMVSMGYNAPSYTETVDNISYRYVSDHYNLSFPCMIYIGRPISGNIYINGELPITYEWSSVPTISGKMGIMELSMIKDANIGDGSRVSGADLNAVERITAGSNLVTLAQNLELNQEVDTIYSGNIFRMTLKRTTASIILPGETATVPAVTISFYFARTTGGVENCFYWYSVPFFGDGTGNVGANYLGFIIDHENEVAALNIIYPVPGGTTVNYCEPGTEMTAEEMHLMYIWLTASPENDPDEEPFVDNEADGGGELIDRPNNPIPEPGIPTLSAYDTGFLSQYVIGKTELKELATFLWSDSFVENVKKFFSDPRQIIMGITISPVYPKELAGTSSIIKAGGISTGVYGTKLSKQFERYDFGTIKLDKRLRTDDDMGGIYFDYSPFTELKLYLPGCGEHSLDTNDCIGKTLNLSYTVDHVSGICCAHLTIKGDKDECHYNYTGQLGVQVPISSEDFGGFYRAILSAGACVGGAMATAATGGMSAPMAIGAAANTANNVINMGKEVQYTSGGGSISGQLASEYPYITVIEPDPFMATNQEHYTGYPYYRRKRLRNMSGFTKIMAIHLDGLSCTEIERSAIRDQLSRGVIIQTGDTLPTPDPTRPEGEESLILLHNLSDVDTIGKKFEKDNQGEVEYVELTSKLLYNQDFAAVGLLVSEYNAGYNYAYIPSFGRVYYIDKITAESGAMVRYDLSCDASESFWSELKECYAIIEANENMSGAKLLVNNNTWFMKQKKNIKTLTFKDSLGNPAHFNRESGNLQECFIITIAGDTTD